jgi:hypothetical protein
MRLSSFWSVRAHRRAASKTRCAGAAKPLFICVPNSPPLRAQAAGDTPFHTAARSGHLDALSLLVMGCPAEAAGAKNEVGCDSNMRLSPAESSAESITSSSGWQDGR